MSRLLHIPDSVVKATFPQAYRVKGSTPHPDASWVIDGSFWCLEYENSSRGLASHVLSYGLQAEKGSNISNVLLVRSLHHQRKHTIDYSRALFASGLITNVVFTFRNCDGTVDTLKSIVSEWMRMG